MGKDNEDSLRWVRVGLNDNGILAIQYANGHSERYRLEIDEKQMTYKLMQRAKTDEQLLSFEEMPLEAGGYVVELLGVFDSAQHRIRMVRTNETSFFEERGFHWINEYPLNR